MNYLDELEAEAIYIFREIAGQFKKPVLLFSGGKDSTVLIYLALKAFYPAVPPFPVMHIDTGHNFPEALAFRDGLAKKAGLQLIVRQVADTIKAKGLTEPEGKFPSRNALQSYTLMDAIDEFCFDACIGGGRRDEEKARAKERIFSIRGSKGAWQPHHQRPELWNIYNGGLRNAPVPAEGEPEEGPSHMRAFPISNWTEQDVWHYIRREQIELPSLYFAHMRKCVVHEGKLIAFSEYLNLDGSETVADKLVRYRTVGDMTCTAAVESNATAIADVITEIENSPISERGETRIDDQMSDAAMEDRKMKGYF